MIQCPACRMLNPAGTLGCECGYSDLTGEVVKDGAPPASAGAQAAAVVAAGEEIGDDFGLDVDVAL